MVPEMGFVKIELSLGSEAKPLHFRRRSLVRTWAQDFAAEGFRACARRRRRAPALGIGYRNSFGRLDQAIPDLLKQLQPVRDAKRLNLLTYDAHA